MKFTVLLLFFSLLKQINTANVLILLPIPIKSHSILGDALVKGLVNRNHNVTLISAFPQKIKPTDYTELSFTNIKDMFRSRMAAQGGSFQAQKASVHKLVFSMSDMALNLTAEVLQEKIIQEILNPNEHFDVIIISQFLNEALLGIGHYFKAPVIALATPGLSFLVNDYVGNPSPYAYVPELFLAYSDHMTFYQRLINTILQLYLNFDRHFFHYPRQNELLHKHFPDAPDIYEIIKSYAIVLSNSHISFSYPRPIVPAVIEIGGFHVPEPKPLPNDLKKIMDNAPHGVIYFSLGTNVQCQHTPPELKQAFINVFSKLKQQILWKWDCAKIEGLPSNILINKWFPQNDILAHPNLKLFITHGGLLSTTEAIIRGVPLLGIPVFGDQLQNVQKAEVLGFAVKLEQTNITTESLTWAVNEALNNPRYTENIKKRSNIMKDEIVPPLEKAMYWIEYVIRYKGAEHLRSAALDLPLYQYLLLDIFGFLILIVVIIITILYLLTKFIIKIIKKIFKRKSKTD